MLVDKTENDCATFFSYKATLHDFAKEMVSVTMSKQSIEKACDNLRHKLVYCMRNGEKLVIFTDKIACDFTEKYNYQKVFPSQQVFDFKLWRDPKRHMKVVKEEENFDILN